MTSGLRSAIGSVSGFVRSNRGATFAVGAGALIVALNVLVLIIRALLGGPGGAPSSSYATTPEGVAAYAELLRRAGYDVEQQRVELRNEPPSSDDVLIVMDADISEDETAVIEDFLSSGGRLVAGGVASTFWIEDVVADPPSFSPTGAEEGTAAQHLGDVKRITSKGEGSWSDPGGGDVAIAGDDDNALLVAVDEGEGRAWLLADASPLKNDLLDEADNAALGLYLAGPSGTKVRFLETVHGYSTDAGLGAIPRNWRWMLYGLGAACLCYMAARGRRLGPAEEVTRPLPPPRREYVDAIAATLRKTGNRRESIEPVVEAARSRLRRRTGLDVAAGDEAIRLAAQTLGMPPDEIRALTEGVASDSDVMAAGRALARVSGADA